MGDLGSSEAGEGLKVSDQVVSVLIIGRSHINAPSKLAISKGRRWADDNNGAAVVQ